MSIFTASIILTNHFLYYFYSHSNSLAQNCLKLSLRPVWLSRLVLFITHFSSYAEMSPYVGSPSWRDYPGFQADDTATEWRQPLLYMTTVSSLLEQQIPQSQN